MPQIEKDLSVVSVVHGLSRTSSKNTSHLTVTAETAPDQQFYDGSSEDSTSSDDETDTGVGRGMSQDVALQDFPARRYPARNRVQRQIEGAIPWDQVHDV